MAEPGLLSRVHSLGDLDLAALLCLLSREHCIISTEPEYVDDLLEELHLVASQTFNLKPTTLKCTPHTTLDDFAASILLTGPNTTPTPRSSSPLLTRNNPNPVTDSYFHNPPASYHTHTASHQTLRALSPHSQLSVGSYTTLQHPHNNNNNNNNSPQIANVVLARDLDRAPKAVQIQALELLRTRRIFTRTSVQAAPKQFLFIAVLGATGMGRDEPRLTEHLNDFFYIAHWHDPLDGFAHLEELEEQDGDEEASIASGESVVRRSLGGTLRTGADGLLHEHDISALVEASRLVNVDIEILRYQMNIISFLRMHRAVAGGVSPVATKHFDQLLKCLAALHGLDYATPGLVALAAKKIYMHRVRIVAPEKERSMQWGSELAIVEQNLEGVGPEDVIEDVLGMVAVPL
ncbi:uncharacterized protein BCR38DRAFT_331387 [Pseudomassariella vexata]|uniref:magnesium chelatase n=1 Tax=Pseudomassariella vexata TaxID=1141098 RepID=A0A1Y2EJW4_9PEZI|nr:uncharacterized protein BCR38DRAFT_331387 [Pseudomassariella vexata]ORY71853.1 hypothetical protein BCR38DRAFT_331387 [Pseudomassariella vexata]